jgi:hypothetical protein
MNAVYEWLLGNKDFLLTASASAFIATFLFGISTLILKRLAPRSEKLKFRVERLMLKRLQSEQQLLIEEGAKPEEIRALIDRIEHDVDDLRKNLAELKEQSASADRHARVERK